jgi:hypothetical protein
MAPGMPHAAPIQHSSHVVLPGGDGGEGGEGGGGCGEGGGMQGKAVVGILQMYLKALLHGSCNDANMCLRCACLPLHCCKWCALAVQYHISGPIWDQ